MTTVHYTQNVYNAKLPFRQLFDSHIMLISHNLNSDRKVWDLVHTSFPSLLEINEWMVSSSSLPFFTSISVATLNRRGREKGGTVRRSPLIERQRDTQAMSPGVPPTVNPSWPPPCVRYLWKAFMLFPHYPQFSQYGTEADVRTSMNHTRLRAWPLQQGNDGMCNGCSILFLL